jgi:DNA-binding XRE family transcriptional regulator
MSRKPKPENENNPLRQLRALICETAAITQADLAERCDIPVPTIRAIEAGQRKFSQAVQKKVERMTGARWDDKKKHWVSEYWQLARVRKGRMGFKVYTIPSTHIDIQTHQEMRAKGSLDAERDRDAVKMRIDALFDEIVSRRWMHLLERIQDFLEDLSQNEFKRGFKDTQSLKRIFTWTDWTFQNTEHPTPELLKYRLRMKERYTKLSRNVNPDGSLTVKF